MTASDRYCAEINAQADLFADHLDGGLRWAREIIATRAWEPPT